MTGGGLDPYNALFVNMDNMWTERFGNYDCLVRLCLRKNVNFTNAGIILPAGTYSNIVLPSKVKKGHNALSASTYSFSSASSMQSLLPTQSRQFSTHHNTDTEVLRKGYFN